MNCGTILLSVLLGIVVLVTLAVLAIIQYGWLGVGMVAVGLLVVWFVGRRLIRLLLMMPFIAKGSVLKNATADVRGVRYLGMQRQEEEEADEGDEEEAMADEEAEAGEEGGTDEAAIVEGQDAGGGASELATMFHMYEIDVEITPHVPATKRFRHWDVDDLMVVPHGTRPSFSDDPTDAELGAIRGVRLWDGTKWVEDEIGKHEGPQRLLLELAADQPLDRGQFQYYFYTFGDIRFPPAGVGPAERRTGGYLGIVV